MRKCFKKPIGVGFLVTMALAHMTIMVCSSAYNYTGLYLLKIQNNLSYPLNQTNNFTNDSSTVSKYLLPHKRDNMDKILIVLSSSFSLLILFPIPSSVKLQDLIVAISLSISPISHLIVGYLFFNRANMEIDIYSLNNTVVIEKDLGFTCFLINSVIHGVSITICIIFVCLANQDFFLNIKVKHLGRSRSIGYFSVEMLSFNNEVLYNLINLKQLLEKPNILKDFIFTVYDDDINAYTKELHAKECRYHFPFYPFKVFGLCCKMKQCSWKKINVYSSVSSELYFDFNSTKSLKNIAYLNKLGVHFLTPFTIRPNFSILNSKTFVPKFYDTFKGILEIFVLREDGISLINRYIQLIPDSYNKLLIKYHLMKKTFKVWPPPLWYYCLKEIRLRIRRDNGTKCLHFVPEYYNDFILNPLDNRLSMDILSIFCLKYENIWTMEECRYGLIQNLKVLIESSL